ncbi:MAG: riboflavin synthase [Phycisphaerales bacterium]|nr:riboflavin synthase [Phycisphaerales bacterium]
MFSGIVEHVATVAALNPLPGDAGVRLRIDAPEYFAELPLGASVAVNGACLTLTAIEQHSAAFDAIPETLANTNLGELHAGSRVNLERAMRIGDRVDGHFVQGHVDGVGVVERVEQEAGEYMLWVRGPQTLAPLLIRKGSITIDGVSLTIVDVAGDLFSVALIPTTLRQTTLGERAVGDRVNLESDILARLIVARVDALIESRLATVRAGERS